MRVSLEWFLLDNLMVNRLLLSLAGALGGVEVRPIRTWGISLLGALWDALALGLFPQLLGLGGRILCLLVTALLLYPHGFFRGLISLLGASLLLGGSLVLLLQGQWRGGVLLCTVPVRTALYAFVLLPVLIRACRYLVHRGYEGKNTLPVTVLVGGGRYALTAFVDSGNLLTEPLSGRPVVLVEGIPLPPGRPLSVEGQGVVELAEGWVYVHRRPQRVFFAQAPQRLGDFDALLPAALLWEGKENGYVEKAARLVVRALCPLVHPPVSGVSGSARGEPAHPPFPGGGAAVPSIPGQGGVQEQAHRAQPAPRGVPCKEV